MHLPHFILTVVLLAYVTECCSANFRRNPQTDRERMRFPGSQQNGQQVKLRQKGQQHQNYKRRNVPDESRIIFPTQAPSMVRTTPRTNPLSATTRGQDSSRQIPITLLFELNNITSQNEFAKRFTIERPRASGSTSLGASLRNNAIEGRTVPENAPFASPATCMPQLTVVPLELSKDPYDFFFPSCTRIEQCGGCCSHQIFECAPTKTENITLQVFKTRYLGPVLNKFDSGEPYAVKLVRHLECQCSCKVKAGDCRPNQVYRPNECRCECMNQEEAEECDGDKFWDANLCLCRCRERSECSTGLAFNSKTCKCELLTGPGNRMGGVQAGFRDI